jgi:hypothetical protein
MSELWKTVCKNYNFDISAFVGFIVRIHYYSKKICVRYTFYPWLTFWNLAWRLSTLWLSRYFSDAELLISCNVMIQSPSTFLSIWPSEDVKYKDFLRHSKHLKYLGEGGISMGVCVLTSFHPHPFLSRTVLRMWTDRRQDQKLLWGFIGMMIM